MLDVRRCSFRNRRPATTGRATTPSSMSTPRPERISSRRSSTRGSTRRSRRRARCASPAPAPASCSRAVEGRCRGMLPFFKLGIGGPVAGGHQYVPWVHLDDVVAGDAAGASTTPMRPGPVNLVAPNTGHQRRTLARTWTRAAADPAVLPVPAVALKLLYGDMAELVTGGSARGSRSPARARVRVPSPGARHSAQGRARAIVRVHGRAVALALP